MNLPIKKGCKTLAPLAGYSDVAFRRICHEMGADLTVTEMVSVAGLNYKSKKTNRLLEKFEGESPSCVQLFGREVEQFERALSHPEVQKFDIIDVNMGCPVRKVFSHGEGSALLLEPERAEQIVKALKKGDKPVSIKMRLGVSDNANALDFAKRMEQAGADFITVHGRTKEQLYSGEADWDSIRKIASALSIPVLGNGDINDSNIEERLVGVYGVAIGRGAVENPQIFLGKRKLSRFELIMKHLEYGEYYLGDKYFSRSLRSFIPFYLKGLPDIKKIRNEAVIAKTKDELLEILNKYKPQLV
ncbi:MAG: tRNA-dihydrouridine synthase family protein [Clostridia bacterium]|nr:tRNA-dihydrouridine synthase family protein [Clostridia bacterium]